MLSKLLLGLVLLLTGHAHADDFESTAVEDYLNEAKTIFSSGGTYFITLNTTYVIIAGVILGALALGALFLSTLLAGLTRPSNSYSVSAPGYNHNYYKRNGNKKRRYQRSDDDFAAKMHQLEKAFKKYSVHDIECQMYVSCESALTHRHEENGPLARIANDIISSMVDRRNFSEAKLSPEMDGITQAFTYGRDAESFGTEDACAPLRSKCVELQNKKHKNY